MKKRNKSDIKGQKKSKSAGRYKNLWLDNGDKPDLSVLVRQPDKPPSQLKESAKAMKEAMPNTHGDLAEGEVKKPKLTRAEKKALRKKADVIPIGSKSLGKTGRKRDDTPADADVIAKLEDHINKHAAAANTEVVGPPKPSPKVMEASAKPANGYSFNNKPELQTVTKGEDEDWYLTYGKKVKDTGRGMTPSGLPITDFLEGGPFAPPKKEPELQTVTEAANEEWSHEELASKYDELQLELHKVKADYERRLGVRDERITAMEKALFDERQAKRVEQFNNSHTQNFEVAVIELQEENSYLTRDNELLSKEVDSLMDDVDKLQRHMDINNASGISKAPLKTLANQFNIFKSQWTDDPLKAWMKLSPYDPRQVKLLRWYFDSQCDARLVVSEERKVFAKWAARPAPALRWSMRKRDAIRRVPAEVEALRNIGVNTAVLRKPDDWLCKKLQTVIKPASIKHVKLVRNTVNFKDFEILPLAGEACHDAYCKVWQEFKSVTPRHEYDAEVLREEREAKAVASRNTTTGKVVIPVIKAVRAVNDMLDYELSSKKRAELKRQQKAEKKRAKAEASRIKREREEQFEKQFELERIKKAQRLAH